MCDCENRIFDLEDRISELENIIKKQDNALNTLAMKIDRLRSYIDKEIDDLADNVVEELIDLEHRLLNICLKD